MRGLGGDSTQLTLESNERALKPQKKSWAEITLQTKRRLDFCTISTARDPVTPPVIRLIPHECKKDNWIRH